MPVRTKKEKSKSFFPVYQPSIGPAEINHAVSALRKGWISSEGPHVKQFETLWAKYCGRNYGVAVANGTVALELALAALNYPAGSEVILPSFAIISCIQAVLYNNLKPVLVDCDPKTWSLSAALVKKKITQKTKAVLVIHMYGHPAEMDPLLALCAKNKLDLIEDAAQAHGAEYLSRWNSAKPAWRRCGSFGTLSCFSFYANKPVTTGEGGMVLTESDALHQRLSSLRNLTFQKKRFYHDELGFNFRMSNLQAAIGVAQISRIDKILAKKRLIAETYSKLLKNIPSLQLPPNLSWARSIYWMYGVVLKGTRMPAAEMIQRLAGKGVDSRPFFIGMHEQPVLKKMRLFKNEHYPVTERLSRFGFYLPSGLDLTKKDIARICSAVRDILNE